MPADHPPSLRSFAEVVLRIGLNLQPGQPLLITDPYDLLGVHPEAVPLAETIRDAAGVETAILTSDPIRLRSLADAGDLRAYAALAADHVRRLRTHLARGGAFLFLTGTAPQLFAGLPPERLGRFESAKWSQLGPLIQRLIRGAGQWTLLPCPTHDWARLAGQDVAALWETLFRALRLDIADPVTAWQTRLDALTTRCDELNAACHRWIRYTGPGTDLTLALPRTHVWCTARLRSTSGIPFVVNLPTEEVFTAPHKGSASGHVAVSRPVVHNGTDMDGIELEFRSGRVVRARARRGEDYLHRLLATDHGAGCVGEVALVPDRTHLTWSGRACHHAILDENTSNHIALGDAYRFCSRAWLPLALNSSLLHLDLPLDAEVELR
jgi:aminopeptidase